MVPTAASRWPEHGKFAGYGEPPEWRTIGGMKKPDPTPAADPLDVCKKCHKPIDVLSTVWIPLGAGVAGGAEHTDCGASS
jgi:hypothetical protein